MYEEFPWVKFIILTIPLVVVMWIFSPTIKWKLVYSLAVPVGVYLALAGKTIGRSHGFGGGR